KDKLPATELDVEGLLTQVTEVIKKITIAEDKMSILLNLGALVEGLGEALVEFTNTAVGFDITTSLYDLKICLDVTKTEEIIVEDELYSNIAGYIDLVEYILSLINKESLSITLEGTYYMDDMPVIFSGHMDLMYDINTSLYSASLDLAVLIADIQIELNVTFVEDKIYIVLYDTVIELNVNELEEVFSVLCEKFDISMNTSELDVSLSTLTELIQGVFLYENSVELDLSQYISVLTKLVLSYEKLDSGYQLSLSAEDVFDATISIDTVSYKEIIAPTASLTKDDLYVLLDNVSYLIEVIGGKAIHFDISDTVLNLKINNDHQEIKVTGYVDVLWNADGYQLAGHITADGFGILVDLDLLVVNDTIYLTISNQTICLKLTEINDFISSALEILSPMIDVSLPSMTELDFNLDVQDLGLLFTANSITMSLEALVGKACEFAITFGLVENGMAANVNVSYDQMVELNAPILISKSEVNEIIIPEAVLTKDDILELLTYVVEGVELASQDEFNLAIHTSINTNGDVVATIDGNVYIKLLDNQEFDARLSLIVHEYKDNSQVGWHQLDVQVISLTTMNTLDPSVDMAMLYAIYGNNPDDLNAVIKVKSTYTGIEDLIQTIQQLMNLDIPSLSSVSETSSMDIRSLIDYIHVEKNSLSLGIEANFLFASMLDERQVMHITLAKNQESKLTGILAENIYVSYTNTMKYTKLDTLELTLEDGQMGFDVPSVEALQEYYDVSEISNLFEALYHNALERTFSISGNIVLKAKVLITITESIPVKIKVGVEENGEPTVHLNIDMNNLKAGAMLASKKTVDVYYHKNYVYIQRTESSSVKRVKVHINEFMDNLVYYLLDFGMGLSNTILNAIDKPVEGDGFVDASKCINSINIQKDTFEFGINMGELTDNFNLEDLFVSLGTSMVYQKNSDGTMSLVPMIHRIN
ncbi:MAG: hypothetical protein K2J85_06635, partial [Anaeroplasmataceae bacterium]|nr:hypothetical protein [Anaeroplasmataceae bacterium]